MQAAMSSLREVADPELLTLTCGGATAQVALRGAELRAWRHGARDLIWLSDPRFWTDTAPLLFPVVGWTRDGTVRVHGRTYPLGLHGFARAKVFRLESRTAAAARLTLEADAATRASYPFDFRLSVDYELGESRLACRLTVTNSGETPMPYACGLHPGFRWPFAGGERAQYRIRFAEAEQPEVPVITSSGLFSALKRPVPIEDRILLLSDPLLAQEALCFLNARSRWLRFEHESGAAICLSVEDFEHFALWSRPGAPFLSIEAWTGHGDPENFSGDLFEKPSMRILKPGAAACHAAWFSYEAV